MLDVGLIGLGAMGRGMAANLHRAGRLAGAWNRTRAKVEAFAAEQGIRLFDSPADLANECRLIISCVAADRDLEQVVTALLPGLRPGTLLVDCSTLGVATVREVAARLQSAGCTFLDAPVSGGVEGARDGTLAMMVGGDPEVLEQARPVLELVAGRVVRMGPVGAGQATKAVNQVMVAGINQAVSEALALAGSQGLDLAQVVALLGQGAAGNWFLDRRGPTLIQDRFAPGFKVALHHKDLLICRELAAAAGVRLETVEQTLADYAQLLEQGHGDEDISSLYRIKRALFPHG